MVTTRITEAIDFAIKSHGDQKRKGNNMPYIVHPLTVGFILQENGYNEDVIIAGILHDVAEDTSYTLKDIENSFGKNVSDLVAGVTEDKSIKDWDEQKDEYLNRLENASEEVKAISGADILDNRRSLLWCLDKGIDIWSFFKVSPQKIMEKTKIRLGIIRSINNKIVTDIEDVIKELDSKIK